jgi:D-serine deaminase-like pyridoxal phosphate-dependent protein
MADTSTQRTYAYYRDAIAARTMPLAFVDLDLLDRNAREIAERAHGKRIRVASKSIRCVPLMERILSAGPPFEGIMAYSAREAVFLSQQGFDDILIAYPVLHEAVDARLCEELQCGKRICCMVDSVEHVQYLDGLGRANAVEVPVCVDIDLSTSFPGLHFGVRRSPLKSPNDVVELCRRIASSSHLRLEGLMGYEAQIAGVPDNARGSTLKNAIVRMLKRRSIADLRERRASIVDALRDDGIRLTFVNGGGTGSVETTAAEDCVTEVTVGSGFFSPTLFDGYASFRHHPAAAYAIEVTRLPRPGIYTCHGGGYVASGVGRDKMPKPYLPEGARLLPMEGAGEVQTPILYDGPEKLRLGDPVFMRYAKAGEMCERFNVLLAISEGTVVGELPTYRGEGQVFL